MAKKALYKVIFHNQGKIFEIYAHSVHQGAMFGFIEIEQLVFGEKTALVLDPSEENLKSEFKNVTRTYIPMHSVIRIDEVTEKGSAKISDTNGDGKVMPFPVYTRNEESS